MTPEARLRALAERVEREPHGIALETEIARALGRPYSPPPPFTCSIDAAATVMPQSAAIDLIVFGDECVIVTLAAGLHFVAHSEVPNGPHAEARARLAAALRAHAVGGGAGGGR